MYNCLLYCRCLVTGIDATIYTIIVIHDYNYKLYNEIVNNVTIWTISTSEWRITRAINGDKRDGKFTYEFLIFREPYNNRNSFSFFIRKQLYSSIVVHRLVCLTQTLRSITCQYNLSPTSPVPSTSDTLIPLEFARLHNWYSNERFLAPTN
jgi:hypothetical protein